MATSLIFAVGLMLVPLIDGATGGWLAPWQSMRATFSTAGRALLVPEVWWRRALSANRRALAGMKSFETTLEEESRVAAVVRPGMLDTLLRLGGAGSEKAYVGRDGWLYYRPDVDAVALRPSGAGGVARSVASLAADLAERDVRLIFVPIPGKASIHPENLTGAESFAGPLVPRAMAGLPDAIQHAWQEEAQARGLDPLLEPMVVDPSETLWRRKTASGEPQFLRADSHWTPGAMEAVAVMLTQAVGETTKTSSPRSPAARETADVEGVGDTALMLELPPSSPLRTTEHVLTSPFRTADGKPWAPDHASPVLLLGDSYTNIYSSKDLGWGESAGLAEQLSRHLGFAVDRLSRNDAGARSAREMLAAEAARDPAWLAGKKVVIWQLAMREVVNGQWSPLPLTRESSRPAREFLVVPPHQPVEVTAQIASVGAMPRVGENPYADFLTAFHLTGLRDADTGQPLDREAVVYAFTMQGRKILPAASLAPGQQVKVRLANYVERADALDPINRGELDNVDLMLETPNFAEWITPAGS